MEDSVSSTIDELTATANCTMPIITCATTEDQIRRCFPLMAQLRPQLDEAEFVARVRKQQQDGYELAFLSDRKIIKAVAGYRFLESLSWGKFIYVDDLVTGEQFRSQGFGQQLFAWLVKRARVRGCDQFHLDSGVQRFGAHRFYLAGRMDIIAYHFTMKLR
jgi:GNAT superfamily N-acetyltransferase